MIDVLVAMQIAREAQRRQFDVDEPGERRTGASRRGRSGLRGISVVRRKTGAHRDGARYGAVGADGC